MHNSNLNYKQMLQCTKVGWKIPCVSLGEFVGPMQEMGMKSKHQGPVDCQQNIEMPGFYILVNPKLVWNSWNLACYHGAATTCRGTNFVPFGAGLGISFSQTLASHNKLDVFGRERATFGDQIISVASYCFQVFFSCQHRTTGVLCEFLWFFGVRLDIFMH